MPDLTPGFRDATADAPARIHFPDVVEGFEALGFRRLGRMERVHPGGVDAVAMVFAEEHREMFREQKSVPMVVLAAEQSNAFVLVDWWWGMPEVRIRTPMLDGSVVETRRAWDRPPVLEKAAQRAASRLDMRREQLISSVPEGGRSIALAAGTPADLWAVHEERVTAWARDHSTQPAPCLDLGQAIELSRRLSVHDIRVVQRIRRILRAALSLLFAPPLLVLLWTWFSDPLTRTGMTVILVGLVLWVLVASIGCRHVLRVRYITQLRPRFVT
jgi:hypothetical protein